MTVRMLTGDVRAMLATLDAESVHCVVTSPPYYGLRDYDVEGQIGLEPSLGAYIDTMVEVFRAVRRVLRSDGTLWLNLGDSYARDSADGLKQKDLMMVPNRVAIALQDGGWWVRAENVWHKPNAMPESVADRPSSAHEKVWMLTKSERYFYDGAAVAEPLSEASLNRLAQPTFNRQTGGPKDPGTGNRSARKGLENLKAAVDAGRATRSMRNVWTIPTSSYKEAHFATFPPALAERCIKAGCRPGGVVLDPFGGSGTTALAADRLGRDTIHIDLNPEYIAMAKRRLLKDGGMLMRIEE